MKKYLRNILERLTGKKVYGILPPGLDLNFDIRRSFRDYEPKIVFDVGANVGQTAKTFCEWFVRAEIHSFEPVKATFDRLILETKSLKNVKCHCVALGSESGTARMLGNGSKNS